MCLSFQLKVAEQDDTPITGRRQAVNVSTRVTYEFNKPATTPYPWFQPQTINHNLANQIFTVPDTGIVPIQINIPQNSTAVNLNVSILIDFSLTVKVATLIFISGLRSAISSPKEGKSGSI